LCPSGIVSTVGVLIKGGIWIFTTTLREHKWIIKRKLRFIKSGANKWSKRLIKIIERFKNLTVKKVGIPWNNCKSKHTIYILYTEKRWCSGESAHLPPM